MNETLETHFKDNGTRRCCGPEKENIHVCDTSRNREACIGSCVQKDKMITSTEVQTDVIDPFQRVVPVSSKSKTTQTVKQYTQVATKSVQTQTNIVLSTPIEFNAPLIQSTSSTPSDSTKLELLCANKVIKSPEAEVEKNQPNYSINELHSGNEVDDEYDSELNTESSDEELNSDPSWNSDEYYRQDEEPESSRNCSKSVMLSCNTPPEKQLKLIIFEEALANVFSKCCRCGSPCSVFYEQAIGTYCKIRVSCEYVPSHQFSWSTGPLLHHMPVLHLLLSSFILCGGLQPLSYTIPWRSGSYT